MKTTEQAAEFLKYQHDTETTEWRGLCLKLQRIARGLPAVYGSALAAAEATPEDERVYALQDIKRGMVAYCDDPNDGNPYGHIFFIAGRDNHGNLLTWSNDVKVAGGVDIVPIEFYQRYWGDKFQFAATWLNGYSFAEFDKPPKPKRGSLGENYLAGIEDYKKIIRKHEKKGHMKLVAALTKELVRLENLYEQYSRPRNG